VSVLDFDPEPDELPDGTAELMLLLDDLLSVQ